MVRMGLFAALQKGPCVRQAVPACAAHRKTQPFSTYGVLSYSRPFAAYLWLAIGYDKRLRNRSFNGTMRIQVTSLAITQPDLESNKLLETIPWTAPLKSRTERIGTQELGIRIDCLCSWLYGQCEEVDPPNYGVQRKGITSSNPHQGHGKRDHPARYRANAKSRSWNVEEHHDLNGRSGPCSCP